MSVDLVLKSSCSRCNSTTDLYGSSCKHMTLCLSCGKTMAENRDTCSECGAVVDRLIREYNVRASTNIDRNYFIGRFATGLPNFSKKKTADNGWLIQKEGMQGRQLTDSLREKYKNKPWCLEDETGLSQYHGQLEGSQSATYYLLMMQGKEFVAIPAGSWYNFNKVAQYKQLTLEEAEEKMKNRRKTADGYHRWMMKAANNGPAAFGEMEKSVDKESGANGGRARKKATDDDEDHASDKGGEEDEEEEAAGKSRPGLNKKSNNDDDEEVPKGRDFDLDDEDIDRGDDWEHEEIFTDDDETVAVDVDEREDLAPEIPAPPEIKQEDDEEEETNEDEGGGLSNSGKELKKLLGRAAGLDESEEEDDDDDDESDDDEAFPFLIKPKDMPKEEPVDNSPSKPTSSGSVKGTPPTSTSKSAQPKRKLNGDNAKSTNGAPVKKPRTEEVKAVKDENIPAKSNVPPKATPPTPIPSKSEPVTEEEIRTVLLQRAPVTTQELVSSFKARLKSPEDKKTFADILKKISKIQKTNGANFVVLREK